MPKKDDLTKTEWSLMNICWNLGESPARSIYEETLKEKQREYVTVKTMLDRLVKKGFLQRKRIGALLFYKPAVSQTRELKKAIDSFVGTVMQNTLAPLFNYYVGKEQLSTEEIEALEALIRKNKGE